MEVHGPGEVLHPSPEGTHFWQALSEHRLELPRCVTCGRPFFYPRALCPHCGSRHLEWFVASGSGTLHSFCVHYRSAVPGLQGAVPFATALVDLDEGPRVMGFLHGLPEDPDAIRCGTRVRAEYLDTGSGRTLLAFRAAEPPG
ncbi:MAG TPA: Zn-ribbon domain-containing OB-fold protein [Marmoricola sp.]|nr:Zn-ribbon domain-containing OB-fold protein [Marmoricola sp.]